MEFDVNMNTKALYRYLLHQALCNYNTWLALFLCAMTIVLFFFTGNTFALLACLIVLISIPWPWTLYLRAKHQMVTNNTFKKPIHYSVNDEGITISQGEEALCVPWDMLFKAVATKNNILVYTAPNNAWIFPLEQLEGKTGELLELFQEYLPDEKIKGKFPKPVIASRRVERARSFNSAKQSSKTQ
jgi:hypothetical protein